MTFENALLSAWKRNEPTQGIWCSIASSFAAEIAASHGFDYACIDLQHGPVDYPSMLPMIQAVQLHGVTPIVRVSWGEPWQIMRALDAGADGVVVPMINNADEAVRAVAACRYPPEGMRSFGPTRTSVAHGTADPDELSAVACILMIETEEGLANLDSIAATPGVDALYIGPADLALSLGLPPGFTHDAQKHEDAIERIRRACESNEIAAGIQCADGISARRRREQGFQMITVANDSAVLKASLAAELASARGSDVQQKSSVY